MLRILCQIIIFLAVASVSYAAEGHRSQFADMAFRFINFAILFGALYFLLRKPVSNYLESRSDAIKKTFDEAKKIREDAENRSREYKKKMEALDAEAKILKDSLIDEGEKEKKRIIEEANRAAERIKEQARFLAEQEVKKARLALKEEMAALITELAEERLKKETKDSDQERLVKEYLTTAGGVQ